MDALFETGCDDATFGTVDHVGYADFTRVAGSFGEAVGSAIRQVESVSGLRVTRIEPDDLVTMTEVAERLGAAGKVQTDAEVPRDSLLIAAVNAALALRQSAMTLIPEERKLVESLI